VRGWPVERLIRFRGGPRLLAARQAGRRSIATFPMRRVAGRRDLRRYACSERLSNAKGHAKGHAGRATEQARVGSRWRPGSGG
jgi:hypothetical protein